MPMHHLGTRSLTTERLWLRRLTRADAEQLFANWAHDPEVTKFLRWPPHPDVSESRRVLAEWTASYARTDFYQWGLELGATGELIGTIGAVAVHDPIATVEVGYCIGQAWWHHGYTSEALAALIRFFLVDVGCNRLEAIHDARNPHSGAVMAKCGMRHEGTARARSISNAGIGAAECYAILAADLATEAG